MPRSGSAWLVNADGPYRTDDDGSPCHTSLRLTLSEGANANLVADNNSGWFVTGQCEILRYRLHGPLRSRSRRIAYADDFNWRKITLPVQPPDHKSATVSPSRSHVMLTFSTRSARRWRHLSKGTGGRLSRSGVRRIGLASGMYVYRLQAGDFVQARRPSVVEVMSSRVPSYAPGSDVRAAW